MEYVTPLPWLDVKMTSGDQSGQEESLNVAAVDQKKVSPVLRSREALETLDDQTLVLSRIYNIPDGTPVTLKGPAGSVELTVRVKEGLDAAVTPTVADRLVGETSTASILWVRTSGDASNQIPVSAVRKALAGTGLYVADSQEGRVNFTDQVRQVAIAIGAMLVFTLLIALSGLANTITISVLERTRELGVLRATGAQRKQSGFCLSPRPSLSPSWAAASASCSAAAWVSQGWLPYSTQTPGASSQSSKSRGLP